MEKKYWLSVIAMLFMAVSSHAFARETITWIYSDFPPVHILSGPYKDHGYGDFVMNLLAQHMPEYDHRFLLSNSMRAKELIKQENNIANPALLKRPDREKYTLFSIPAYVLLPNAVLISKQHSDKLSPYLNDKGQVQLDIIITESTLRLGINAERAYGGTIDAILIKHKGNKNIYTNFTMLESQMAMMHRGRLDYIIGYPIEGQFLNKALGGKSTIESFPIEGMPDYFLGYIGCPKNEWGKEVITKINAVLQSHRNTPEYHAAYEFWLDENSIKRYREFVKEVY